MQGPVYQLRRALVGPGERQTVAHGRVKHRRRVRGLRMADLVAAVIGTLKSGKPKSVAGLWETGEPANGSPFRWSPPKVALRAGLHHVVPSLSLLAFMGAYALPVPLLSMALVMWPADISHRGAQERKRPPQRSSFLFGFSILAYLLLHSK